MYISNKVGPLGHKRNNMKLYTEEQVRKAIDFFLSDETKKDKIIETLTPIELLRDVDIGKIVLGNSPIMEHRDSGYFALGAMEYNKWLKEQILNQNK